MVPVLLSLEDLPENSGAGVGMFPEIVIADNTGDFRCRCIPRHEVAGNDPGCADLGIDAEKRNRGTDRGHLLLAPAVMVPPFDHPAVFLRFLCQRIRPFLEPDVGDRERVPFPGRRRDKGEECNKFPDRTPDRKYAVFTVFHPVDGIGPYCIEVVVRQVDDMCGSRGDGRRKALLIIRPGWLRHSYTTWHGRG